MRVKVLFTSFIFVFAAVVFAADTVDGSYTVNGRTTVLKYVYASKYPDHSKPYNTVVLSVAEIPREWLTYISVDTFREKAMEDGAQMMVVVFKPDGKLKDAFIFDKSVEGSMLQITPFTKLESTRFDPKGVTGKISLGALPNYFEQKISSTVTFSMDWPSQ